MPQTIDETYKGQIIGGIFESHDNADLAVQAFEDLDIAKENIQVVVKHNNSDSKDNYATLLMGRGFSKTQALYYNKVVREGKILVVVYEVTDPAPIIDIFNKYNAEFNPNGSRNLRDDVLGMTTGAVFGAAAGGLAGAVLGGPLGAAAGGVAGAVVGGGSGAAVGIVVEHKK